jgi:prepilin-type N-terminal cleavage/methylation domain-containing protein
MPASRGAAEVREGGERDAGFTLIETLVALIIMITMATLLYRGFSGGLRAADAAEGAETALRVAQSRLAVLGTAVPLRTGEQEGSEEGVQWRTVLRPYGPAAKEDGATQEPQAFWATVTVTWRGKRGSGRRNLQLTTIKLGQVE